MNILGGMSTHGSISIQSDKFVARATSYDYNDVNFIGCSVKRLPAASEFLNKHRRFPVPRLVRLFIFIFQNADWFGKIFMAIWLALMVKDAFFTKPAIVSVSSGGGPHVFAYFMFSVLAICFFAFCAYIVNRFIGQWHAAEHMAIAAYDRNKASDLQSIAKESPVNDKCGGRLFLPFMAGFVVAFLVANFFSINDTLIQLVSMECILWVDKLIGWDKIPVSRQASHLLQKYITTRTPDKVHLLTAQKALESLVSAHNALEASTSKSSA